MARDVYRHLLSPFSIGNMAVRNRIVVTAMGVSLAEEDGTCGPRIRAYHEAQARGGAGLIITGATGVAWPHGCVQDNQVAISDDRFIPGLAAVAKAVHGHGAKFAVQLHFGGQMAFQDALKGWPLVVPSVPPYEGGDPPPFLPDEQARSALSRVTSIEYAPMTEADIRQLIDQFAAAAVRAVEAGVDGVEIHGGHGYILSSFLSAHCNRRDDRYGGSLENRARLLLEVLAAVRGAVGRNYPVWVKLDSREVGKEGGITIADAVETARMVEKAGADAITVTAFHSMRRHSYHSDSHTPHIPAANLDYAAKIKRAVAIPIIASGRIEPERAEQAVRNGEADLISMGRKLLADPALPNKLAAAAEEKILPCIYCYTCISAIYTAESTRCAVNPELGFEYLIRPAAPVAGASVAVIGGGPGGMEATRRLAALGYRVTLLEKADRLGGTLRVAAIAYEPNERLLDWLTGEVEASGADIRTGTEATPDLLRALQPVAVVVATGAARPMPSIPGTDQDHVFGGSDLHKLLLGQDSAELQRKTSRFTRLAAQVGLAVGATPSLIRKATRVWMPLGKSVVIYGGGLVGLELAEFLCERGRAVTVVDEATHFGEGLQIVRRMRLLEELRDHGVDLFAGAHDFRIGAGTVSFVDDARGHREIAADSVIVAAGATKDLTLADTLRQKGFNVHACGDCTGVGYIEGAMRGAQRVVEQIAAGAR